MITLIVQHTRITAVCQHVAFSDHSYFHAFVLLLSSHRNICRFLGFDIDRRSGKLQIFMEKISGGSITSILRSFGPLPDTVNIAYTKQILEGLIYMHANRVVHRDMKGDWLTRAAQRVICSA